MTFKSKKKIKYVSSILVFSILFVGLKFIFNKSDYCLTLIKFNIIEESLDKFNLDKKRNILFEIDKQNQNIENYFRFTHKIVATSSKDGKCEKNTRLIIDNFEIYMKNEVNFLTKKIDQIEKVNINNILFLLFFILALSALKFLENLIKFFKKEIRF